MSESLFGTCGKFDLGCNYWASHAGVHMWSDWRPDVIEEDLQQLAKMGLKILRVFPLWPEFQPINAMLRPGPTIVEMRHGEESLGADAMGTAGVSPQAMERFGQFAEIAEKHGFSLIVALVTGWMSGRLFVPPALAGRNILTDATAIRWELRFVKCFVEHFRESQAIAAWGLGNECNVMGPTSQDEAYAWTATISNAIRAADPTRPIISDMHSLLPDSAANWRIQDQAELTDVLTTHPYPIFTPHCDNDPLNTIRSCLHSVAESCMYGDVGNCPCLPEEFGTLGPMVASEEIAADYTRTCLFSNWAHDNRGLIWWCANEQAHLPHPPYDWQALECELGLLRQDRTPKPAALAMKAFAEFLDSLPFDSLGPRAMDAVCILSHEQDTWAAAYSSFVMATQAGLAIEFQFVDQPLKDANVYLLPNATGSQCLPRRQWLALLDKVRAGATLYISSHSVMLSEFEDATGLRLQTRERAASETISFDGVDGLESLTVDVPVRLNLESVGAEVLGRFDDGDVAFSRNSYGRGEVYFMAAPVELHMAENSGVFTGAQAQAAWRLYEHVGRDALAGHVARKDHPLVGLTEHTMDDGGRVLVLINYSPNAITTQLTLQDGWSIASTLYGEAPKGEACTLPANDALVLMVKAG